MFTVLGTILGIVIELVTPWSDIIMKQVNSVLSDPSIHSNSSLSSLIFLVGVIGAYLFLPIFGAGGGFFADNSG